MKIKFGSLSRFSAAIVLSLTSLLTISMPLAHAAGPFTCTWTGAGDAVNFNDTSNWDTSTLGADCNGGAPVSGNDYDLVFPDIAAASPSLSNNILGLTIDSITFNGTTSAYSISGDAISLAAGGIVDNSTATQNISNDITLSANQLWTGTSGVSFGGVINLGSFNLGITAPQTTFGSNLTGTGSLTINPGHLNSTSFLVASPGFSGAVDVQSGVAIIDDIQALGSGAITIQSGAMLNIDIAADIATLSNDLQLAGSGDVGNGTGDGAINDCIGDGGGCSTNDTNLTLSGHITLTANTTIGVGNPNGSGTPTVTVSGPLGGAFTLTADPGSGVNLVINSSTNTSNTPNTGATAPRAPDTGLAYIAAHPGVALGASVLAAASLLFTSRRLKTARR